MDGFPTLISLSEIQGEIINKLLAQVKEGLPSPAYAIELKNYWNSTLPVFRLAPEILLEIFEVLASAAFLPPRYSFQYKKNPYTWIRCTHICSHWRKLALGTPSLWRRIGPASDECMETMMVRAGTQVALSIRLEYQPWLTENPGVQPKVSQNTFLALHSDWFRNYRIESLYTPVHPSFVRLETCSRSLKTLVLYGATINANDLSEDGTEVPLFHLDALPMLRELTVLNGSPSTTWSAFRATLEALNVDTLLVPLPVSEWIEALMELPRLRKLRLVDAITDDPDSDLDDASAPLLHLNELCIQDSNVGTAALSLMDHIRTKELHCLMLQAALPGEDDLSPGREYAVALVRALEARRDSDALYLVSLRTMDKHPYAYIFVNLFILPTAPNSGINPGQPPASPRPRYQNLTLKVDSRACSEVVSSLLHAFSKKRLVRLDVDVHFEVDMHPSYRSTEFPELQTLQLTGQMAPSFLTLVTPQSSPATAPADGQQTAEINTDRSKSNIPFPRLSNLFLIDITWTDSEAVASGPTLLDQLIETLQNRKQHTGERLGRVAIYGSRIVTAQDIERLRDEDVAEKVEWSGPDDIMYQGVGQRWRCERVLEMSRHRWMIQELQIRWLTDLRRAQEALTELGEEGEDEGLAGGTEDDAENGADEVGIDGGDGDV